MDFERLVFHEGLACGRSHLPMPTPLLTVDTQDTEAFTAGLAGHVAHQLVCHPAHILKEPHA